MHFIRNLTNKIGSAPKATVCYVASNVISRALAFLMTPLFTRALSPAEYGIYSLYTAFMGIFTVFATLEISGNAIYRGLLKFDGEKKESFISASLGLVMTVSAVFLVLALIFRKPLSALSSLSFPLILMLSVQVFLNAAEGIYFALKRYGYSFKTVALINVCSGFFTPILALVLIRLGGGGVSRIIAPLAISSLTAIPISVDIFRKGRRFFDKECWKFLLSFSLPMLPHYLFASLSSNADRIIIARIFSESELGKYSAAYSLGFILSLVSGGALLGLAPWITRSLAENNAARVKCVLVSSFKIFSYLSLIYLVFAPELFGIIAPTEYKSALPVIYPTVISVVFSFMANAYLSCILHSRKPGEISKNSFFTALITVSLCLISVNIFGYTGAAFAHLLSSAFSFYISDRTLKKNGIRITEKGALWKMLLTLLLYSSLLYALRSSLTARLFVLFSLSLIVIDELPKLNILKLTHKNDSSLKA